MFTLKSTNNTFLFYVSPHYRIILIQINIKLYILVFNLNESVR